MSAYVYLLGSLDPIFTKVGITSNVSRRVKAHTGNASNPLQFTVCRLVKVDSVEQARAIEALTCRKLAAEGYGSRGKRELFRCPPSTAMDALRGASEELGMCALFDAPQSLSKINEIGFIGIPYFLADDINEIEANAYHQGFKDALFCLSFLDKTSLNSRQLKSLAGTFSANGIEIWRNLFDSLSIAAADSEQRGSINQAYEAVARHNHGILKEWQENSYDFWPKLRRA
jgi:hypothetical protein